MRSTLCLCLLAATTHAAEIFVSPNGNDANPGTESKPLATLQAAVDQLQPGDTCVIRGGVYRETVTFPRSGTARKPITLKPYGSERVTVSGCDPVTGWTPYTNRIWKAAMPWTLGTGRNQVFCGGQVMIEARYPNVPAPGLEVPVSGLSPLWPTYGEFSLPKETRATQPGRIVSKLLENQPEDYWKGALYCGVHFEGWCAQTGVIEHSKPGEISVGDRTEGWWFGSAFGGGYPQEQEEGRGMIVGHLHALDVPAEWHWQDAALYFIAPDGGEPRAVEAKRRQLAFDLSGRAYIRIEKLAVCAASMRLENAAHCTVDGCDLAYISHYTRHYGIGKIEHGRDTIRSGETGLYVSGHDNAFLNCSVRFSAGTGFHLRGYHHTIHNCLIDEVSYVGHYLNAITDAVDDYPEYENKLVGGHVITFNTMRNAGRHFFNFYGNGPSLGSRDRGPMDYASTLFAGNHLYNGMLLTRDAGFITSFYASGGTLNGRHSQVAYNVLHDCYDIAAMRWNILGMIYLDNGSREVDVHHNLLWAAPGSLQCGIWFNPPNINVSDHDNVFHGLFTRTCAELRDDDFPNGEPFRFGHDFAHPPAVPPWPQLECSTLEAEDCVLLSDGVAKDATAVRGLRDGDWIYVGTTDFSRGWQSAVLRFAGEAKAMNTDRSAQGEKPPRHQKPTDPLVLDTRALDGSGGASKNWTVQRLAPGGWLRFNQVPLGDGYRRFRAVYGTTGRTPRRIEVHLDQTNGLLVGQALLPATDKPRKGSIQMFEEAVGELAESAKGTHDVYFVGFSDDGKPVAEFEYFRFERARTPVALPKNDFRLELRVGGRDGEKIGEFIPRFTGGTDDFNDFVAHLEPAQGVQPLFLVVRSTLPGPVGAVDCVRLQKARPIDWSEIDLSPRRTWLGAGGMILPEASNRPCASPADKFRQPVADRPFFRATRLASAPAVDGDLKEWSGRVIELKQSLEGAVCEEGVALAWVGTDADALYLAMRIPVRDPKALRTAGHLWGATDGVEIALQDSDATPPGPILSLHGWADGHFCAPDQAGAPDALTRRLTEKVTYRSTVGTNAWTCEWRIPFDACGLKPATVATLACNLTARNADENAWRTWKIASGATYDLHNGGTLVFSAGEALLSGTLKNGLAVWLDAADAATVDRGADGKVAVWKDKSGQGRNAAQAQAEFRPRYLADGLNGRATLMFCDAQRTRLELPDLSDQPIDATVIAVISNPDPGQPNNQHQRIFTASDGKAYDYLCGISCNLSGAETGGPRQIVYEGKDRWAKRVRVGCFSPNDQTFFNGDISEILVYNRTLTCAEKTKVLAYLMGKWEL
jgi:hypothetical protein